ncbi:hypothetical protein TRVA0_001S02916 [Trichomonascus vanleenenianus]|uniref:Pun1p n=1 Tax=Trichomonascus vanleenenianus TaxID=2268995 RepID=UPI003ECB69B3
MFGCLLALVLGIVTVLGSSPNAPGLQSLYFVRVNFTGMTTVAINGVAASDGSASSLVQSSLQGDIHDTGISDFYDAGVSGYCQGTITTEGVIDVQECHSPFRPFWFDLQGFLDEQSNSGISVNLPTSAQNYASIQQASSKAMWACYVSAVVVLGVQFLWGFFAYRSRGHNICISLLGAVCFLLLLIASGLACGIYGTFTRYVNDGVGQYGIYAKMDGKIYVITWIATAAALWSTLWWLFALCCSPPSYPLTDFEEKQPFIGYIPRRNRFYY